MSSATDKNNSTQLYCLNQEFRPGMVFNNLHELQYETVVGLDIGHGECMAYICQKDSSGKWNPAPLVVDGNVDRHIPSYIAYVDGKSVIGVKAKNILSESLHVYFKREPKEWNIVSNDKIHTYGRLMEDYISALWENILSKNADKFESCTLDKLLITVGCPASGSWTEPEQMKEYAKLVKRATKCEHVAILPESTAAIMAPIYSRRAFDLHRGIAIYDLGSSTLDFTYILLGKVLIIASIPLGGSDIDKAMLRYIARENETDLGDLNNCDLASAHTDMRIIKEEFYDAEEVPQQEKSVLVKIKLENCVDEAVLSAVLEKMGIFCDAFSYRDKLSQLLAEGRENDINANMLELFLDSHKMAGVSIGSMTRKKIYGVLSRARTDFLEQGCLQHVTVSIPLNFDYALDKEMMDAVIGKDKEVSANKLPSIYKGKSWIECVEKFFEYTKELITLKSTPKHPCECDTVVITGGTCKVTAVREIAKKCYFDKVIFEDDPSSSVAKGLSYAKGCELGAAEQIETLKNELCEGTESCFDMLCDDFAQGGLFDLFWPKLVTVAQELDDKKDHTQNEFNDKLKAYTADDCTFMEYLQNELSRCAVKYIDGEFINNAVLQKANTFAANIYGTQASALPNLSADLIASASLSFDGESLSAFIGEQRTAHEIQRIVMNYLHTGLANLFHKMRILFSNKMTASDCEALVETFELPGAKVNYRYGLGKEFSSFLKKSQDFKNVFFKLVEEKFEIAVGIVLFWIFEDYCG